MLSCGLGTDTMPTLIAIPMPEAFKRLIAGASDPIGAGLKARARCQIRRPGMGHNQKNRDCRLRSSGVQAGQNNPPKNQNAEAR